MMTNTDDLMRDGMKTVLGAVSVMLEQIPTDDLERYIQQIDTQVQMFEAFGWVTDPTAYRKAIHGDREYESIKAQLEVARHLLHARRELDNLRELLGGG